MTLKRGWGDGARGEPVFGTLKAGSLFNQGHPESTKGHPSMQSKSETSLSIPMKLFLSLYLFWNAHPWFFLDAL